MVPRNTQSGSQSPCYNIHVELDNRALKAKNSGLTQAIAKLQQEHAELSKQNSLLQEEIFEINSKYVNLKNVMSILDFTRNASLLTQVVDTFTEIVQLCSVASNISNTSSTSGDTRIHAVKPQIVNGRVLHNPTITLSRLYNQNTSYSPRRPSTSHNSSNVTLRPSTSRSTSGHSSERHASVSDHENDNDENRVNRTEATKNANALSYDKVRLVEENASLLVETNMLRKNLHAEANQSKKLNALVGLSYISPKLAQKKVDLAAATNMEIHNKYKEKLEENEKAINSPKEENDKLLNRITELQYEEQEEEVVYE